MLVELVELAVAAVDDDAAIGVLRPQPGGRKTPRARRLKRPRCVGNEAVDGVRIAGKVTPPLGASYHGTARSCFARPFRFVEPPLLNCYRAEHGARGALAGEARLPGGVGPAARAGRSSRCWRSPRPPAARGAPARPDPWPAI